jgi:hypothetical protein
LPTQRTGGALAKSRLSNFEQVLGRMRLEEAKLIATASGHVSHACLLCLDDGEAPLSRDEIRLLEARRVLCPKVQAVIRRGVGVR